MYGGATIDSTSITIAATGSSGNANVIGGYGVINGTITDDGIISAGFYSSAATKLDLTGNIDGTGSLELGGNATLELDGTLAGSLSIDFLLSPIPGPQVVDITKATDQVAPTIDSIFGGDIIDLPFLADNDNSASVSFNDSTDVLTVTADGGKQVTLQFDADGDYSNGAFFAQQDSTDGTEIVAACFCAGTRIRCRRGEVAIENLRVGDLVRTRDGTFQPIRWIGRRSYPRAYVAAYRWVRPVLIKAGALGDGLPQRDLRVSPEHAMYLDGMLIAARDLVNGTSIVQPESAESASYFHLEFDRHEIIFAEGAPSESFVDDESRLYFDNAAEYWLHHPEARPMPGRFYAPRLDEGPDLERVRNRLARCACDQSDRPPNGASIRAAIAVHDGAPRSNQ